MSTVTMDPDTRFTPIYQDLIAELGEPVLTQPAPPPERVEKCSKLGKGVTYVTSEDGASTEAPCPECDGLHS